jgi:hypothetical protein
VTYPGFTPVGNATLVVANVLMCNKHSQKKISKRMCRGCDMHHPHLASDETQSLKGPL